VWTATGTLSFAAGESNAGRIDENGGVRVEAESLADALGPRLAEVDLVKMDIEGAETAVLPGLLGRLRSTCRIIVEWHDAGRTRGVLRGALKAAGWTGNRLARVGPHELWLLGAPGVRTHHT
jgi:hypothetical protein